MWRRGGDGNGDRDCDGNGNGVENYDEEEGDDE